MYQQYKVYNRIKNPSIKEQKDVVMPKGAKDKVNLLDEENKYFKFGGSIESIDSNDYSRLVE